MKKNKSIFSLLSILAFAAGMLVAFSAFTSNSKDIFELKGKVKGLNGAKLILINMTANRNADTLGQAVVKNEAFKITGKMSFPSSVYISFPETKHVASFWLVPGKVEIELDTAKYLQKYPGMQITLKPVVKGSKENDIYEAYQKISEQLYAELNNENRKLKETNDPEEKKRIESKISEMREELAVKSNASTLKFIKENNNSFVSAYLLAYVMNDNYAQISTLQSVMKSLSEDVKKSSYYLENEKILNLIIGVQPGKPAPDFTLKDSDDKDFSLSSLKGKVVLIDFWASWCRPCIESIPSMKILYDAYKDQGFEILGVTNDKKKEAWLNALKQHNVNWKSVIDRFSKPGSTADIVTLYCVHLLPTTILIDKNGIIVAKDLHGAELENKLKELLK